MEKEKKNHNSLRLGDGGVLFPNLALSPPENANVVFSPLLGGDIIAVYGHKGAKLKEQRTFQCIRIASDGHSVILVSGGAKEADWSWN